jgi:hypothetical protein
MIHVDTEWSTKEEFISLCLLDNDDLYFYYDPKWLSLNSSLDNYDAKKYFNRDFTNFIPIPFPNYKTQSILDHFTNKILEYPKIDNTKFYNK